MNKFLVFCDESCHQYGSDFDVMDIGGVLCNKNDYEQIKADIKKIKDKHNFSFREVKWSKVSLKYKDFYKDLIDYFFDSDRLAYSVIVLKDRKEFEKTVKNRRQYEEAYSYLYNLLMIKMTDAEDSTYDFYIDRKDGKTHKRIKKIYDAITSAPEAKIAYKVDRVECVDSESNVLIQMADLFSGCITYIYRRDSLTDKPDRCKFFLAQYVGNKVDENKEKILCSKKFSIFILSGKKND